MTHSTDQNIISANLLIHETAQRPGEQHHDKNDHIDAQANLLVPRSNDQAADRHEEGTRMSETIDQPNVADKLLIPQSAEPEPDNHQDANEQPDGPADLVTHLSNQRAVPDHVLVASIEQQESIASNVYQSPNGTKYWTPNVPPDLKPYEGARFRTIDEAVGMYERYAERAGFSTRLGTSKRDKAKGVFKLRYILCSRANKPKDQEAGNTSSLKRCRSIKATDCKACVKIRRVKRSTDYVVYKFIEQHNHGLTAPENLDLSRKKRKLDFAAKQFIADCRNANIGPTKAHNIYVVLKGGHQNVRGTTTEFKNFGRDIREFIGDRDAQMVVDKFNERVENKQNYTFKTHIVEKELQLLFWCDGVSKTNYHAFGDVVAFDATYDMIFVPFTGVDHHKKCTIFGAGLIHNETIESYSWLLQKFLEAHDGKQPLIILTDQDCAMKQAVNNVFDKSVHRLCMWHITQKIPAKIKGSDETNAELKQRIHKLVWNVYIEPHRFEKRWNLLMTEYGLEDHAWMNEMYAIREQWIPCYFRDIPMCCLMKTTSRCESANHMFKANSSPHNTLVQFMLCYDTSVDKIRNKQRKLSYETDTTNPERYKTSFSIERHANEVYTRTLFWEVQKEIDKSNSLCYVAERGMVDGVNTYLVAHQDHTKEIVNEFKVTFNKSDLTVSCVCMGFTRVGYLCRHVFCVFRHHNIFQIPAKYIHPRWCRDAIPASVHLLENRLCDDQSRSGVLWRGICDNVNMCRDRVRGNIEKLQELSDQIQAIKDKLFSEIPYDHSINKKDVVIEDVIAHKQPAELSCTAPRKIRNKGCGKHKRTVGPGEKAIKSSKKKRRKCNFCGKLVRGHDKRNCPLKKEGKLVEDDSSTDKEDEIYEDEETEESGYEDSGSDE
ncbi:protein FAR1-RELATED SEQUENCE 5-like [Helianthus annuus]|uniref:protein FAR1-RELATED SEQUENCE 5-like n=1 Tax=Helianthus annuus TaxID=4232 RepID=UPI000B8F3C4A|nr:protein FAR1-RELATED SEQUENCE 5-like [Helianthus annuus]